MLRGIDLHLPAGASVAVVGETGSGKTTIAKLLCRLADPTDGAVRVGGRRPRDRRPGVAARVDPDGAAGRLPVRHHPRRERAGRAPRRHRRRGARRLRGARASAAGSTTSPGASTRRSASGARTCRWASASSSRWPAPSWAIPGLLILDEATSSVDPETEQVLTEALDRVSRGPHRREHRPPAVDRRASRPGGGGRRRRDRGARHARRAGRRRRDLRRPLRELARQHPGRPPLPTQTEGRRQYPRRSVATVDDIQKIVALDHGLAGLSTLRGDGSVQSTVVNAGVIDHPVSGQPVAAFVGRPATRKIAHLRENPRATLLWRAGLGVGRRRGHRGARRPRRPARGDRARRPPGSAPRRSTPPPAAASTTTGRSTTG